MKLSLFLFLKRITSLIITIDLPLGGAGSFYACSHGLGMGTADDSDGC